MANEDEAPARPERATQAQTRAVIIALNEFVLAPDRFCHRDPADLTDRERLKALMNSLITEGLQNPVEFARDGDGRPVPTKGHRRISAMRQLALENVPGFTEHMAVAAVEVLEATPHDLLCRSVSDNVVRQNLTMGERLRAAKTLHEGGVEAGRAAFALNYSTKQYLRDLRIAHHGWMREHLERDEIGHTAASDLLEAAEKVDRAAELRDHLGGWVAAKRQEFAAAGKEKKLRGLLTKSLSAHWVALLHDGKALDDVVAAPAAFVVDIDAGANRITVAGKLDLLNAPLETLEKAGRSFASMQKVVDQYRTARGAVEGPRGPQDAARRAAEDLKRLATAEPTSCAADHGDYEPSGEADGADGGA